MRTGELLQIQNPTIQDWNWMCYWYNEGKELQTQKCWTRNYQWKGAWWQKEQHINHPPARLFNIKQYIQTSEISSFEIQVKLNSTYIEMFFYLPFVVYIYITILQNFAIIILLDLVSIFNTLHGQLTISAFYYPEINRYVFWKEFHDEIYLLSRSSYLIEISQLTYWWHTHTNNHVDMPHQLLNS